MTNIKIALRSFVCLLTIAFVGCSETADTEDEGITVSWTIREYPLYDNIFYCYRTDDGISDVNVCGFLCTNKNCTKYEEIACTETDGDGVFTLNGVPKHSKVLLTFEKDGLAPRLVALETGNSNLSSDETYNFGDIPDVLRFPPMTNPPILPEGVTKKEDTGAIVALALEFYYQDGSIRKPVAGTRVSIVEESQTYQPYYTDKCGCSKEREEIIDGFAGFEGLKPDTYTVEYDLPKSEREDYFCYIGDAMADRLVWGFQTETPNRTRVPVMEGFRTITLIMCYNTAEPPDDDVKEEELEEFKRACEDECEDC